MLVCLNNVGPEVPKAQMTVWSNEETMARLLTAILSTVLSPFWILRPFGRILGPVRSIYGLSLINYVPYMAGA